MRWQTILLVGTFVALQAGKAQAQEFDLQPPGDREFVSDKAGMLDEPSITHIRDVCDKLLTSGLRKADISVAICETIHHATASLESALPRTEHDVNELPDTLVLLD